MRVLSLLAAIAFVAVVGACGDDGRSYDLTVNFNESVTQADLDETAAYLRTFQDDFDFFIQESFPPVGRAEIETETPDFCNVVESELEAKPYVRDARCDSGAY